ncbi:phosphatase PAP2 family protein [Candidatus Microgenomates bacterium]|nr:phosphatase PAP2 family protein [Candidatus Microgenomates bacterium]
MFLEKYLVEFVASFLIWIMVGGLIVLWRIDGRIKKETALHAFFALTLAWIFANIIKDILPTPRPFMLNNLPIMVLFKPNDGAFPSGHAAMAFALAVTVWLHNRKWGIFYLICALLVGIARVIANVHYPLDIIGGALVGTIMALAVERIHLFSLIATKKRRKA